VPYGFLIIAVFYTAKHKNRTKICMYAKKAVTLPPQSFVKQKKHN